MRPTRPRRPEPQRLSRGCGPLDAGPLSEAATLERMAFLHIGLNMANGWPWQSGWKVLGPTG